MAQDLIKNILANIVTNTDEAPPQNNDNISLETLVLLVNTQRLNQLQDETLGEFKTLKERQAQVSKLHTLLKKLNNATDDRGNLEITDEIQELIDELKELDIEVEEGKTSFTKEERERLVENVRMSVDDLNVQNEMQMQTISRLTNERYESYQMARSIMRPLHESKSRIAQGIAGR